MLVVQAQQDKMQEIVGFLSKVTIFETLTKVEISRMAEVVHEEDFDEDEAIIEQGEVDNSMFIIMQGSAVACITKGDEEIEVKHYQPGRVDHEGGHWLYCIISFCRCWGRKKGPAIGEGLVGSLEREKSHSV